MRLFIRSFLLLSVVSNLSIATSYSFAQKQVTVTPIIFVHGMLAAGDTWNRPIQFFQKAGYPRDVLYVFDWNTLDFNRENSTEKLIALIKQVRKTHKVKQVNLVGHSAGGAVCMAVISDKKAGKWVKKYVHVASGALSAEPIVPTLNLFSPDDKITGGRNNSSTENKSIEGLDHYEIATSFASFQAMYAFFNGEKSTITAELEKQETVQIAGRALTLGENSPVVFAKVEVFELEKSSGKRKGSILHEVKTNEEGYWGPLEVSGLTPHEIVIYPTTINKRNIHYFHPAFERNQDLIYLRTLPTGGMAAAFLGSLPENNSQAALAIFIANQAAIASRDELSINERIINTEKLASASKTPIAFFVFQDSKTDPLEEAIKSFLSVPFMTGVNQELQLDKTSVIRFNDQEMTVFPIPSAEGIMVVVMN
ncbi:MAG: alpha/beta hydrolase [Crocinitomicaceae bacterium]|nr:alpha/beta hydrolase [Crocinitomicaceae bacterium]